MPEDEKPPIVEDDRVILERIRKELEKKVF